MFSEPQIPKRAAVLLAVLGVATLGAGAQQADITWSSSFLASNLDSTGAPFDESYSFYLGVFNSPPQDPPWMPDASNTALWADYWITADVALYDSTVNHRFASGYNLESLVEGINLTGRKGYIWGVNRKTPGEWILVTGASWTWPSDGGIAFPQNWNVHSGSAVLGSINEDGVHMRTARVTDALPPRLRPEMWRRLHFTADEIANHEATVSGWLADPNQNGQTNMVDYALGSDPRGVRSTGGRQVGPINLSGADFLSLSVSRDPNSDAILVAEVSDDLTTWLSGSPHVVIEDETPSSLVIRDTAPIAPGSPRRFLRLQISLPLNP